MSHQKDLLREIAAALNSQGERRVSEWFTEDFRLHDPTAPEWPLGHRGAAEMLDKTTSAGPSTKLELRWWRKAIGSRCGGDYR
jgi:hypothetical protein